MSKLPEGRASGTVMDGAQRVIPGMADGSYMGDQAPFLIQGPLITLATTAKTAQGAYAMPFAAKIIGYGIACSDATATGSVTFVAGTLADDDKFINDLDISGLTADSLTTGTTTVTTATGFIDDEIDAGDIVTFGTSIASAAGGTIAPVLVVVPRQA